MPRSHRNCVERKPGGSEELQGLSADALARLAQAGDTAAFAALAAQIRPGLLVVLTKRMNEQYADAEDVVQESLTLAWQNIKAYDSNRSFSAWIYTIAFRRATDYLRRKIRRQKQSNEIIVKEDAHSTIEAHATQEAADNIWSVAKQVLSPTQYEALWLRYAEELPVAEIAATMGKTIVGTRVSLHRARAKIRTQLGCMSDFNE